MLFESFTLTLVYREALCDLDIREVSFTDNFSSWEIVQGGLAILTMTFNAHGWEMTINEDASPIVKQDTERFVSQELINILKQGIVTHYDCFTNRKIKYQDS